MSGVPQVSGAMGVMVNTEPEVMSRAVTQAEDVKNILLFSSWSDPSVDGRSCCGSLTATTMTFFASFPFAGSAEPVTTHSAPKGTCWKATAGINKMLSVQFSFWEAPL